MDYIKKRFYRIIESVFKKILLSKKSFNNKNLDKAIRSAIYNVKNDKNGLNLSINKNRKLLLYQSDWNSKKLFIDEEFEVVDIEEGAGNRTGTAKHLVCKNKDGSVFNSNIKGTEVFWCSLARYLIQSPVI